MKDIAIYGAGGLGRETALLIQQINREEDQWNLIGFYDDGLKKGLLVDHLPILGGIEDFGSASQGMAIAVAIADPTTRKAVVDKLPQRYLFPTLVHPTCLRGAESNQFGKGCILTAGCVLTTGVALGGFVILNLLSTVGHDVVLGDFSTVMPGCSISGNVKIGECTMIGTGARILQNLTIGSNCKIGAGAVVTKNFSDHKTIMGVPANER